MYDLYVEATNRAQAIESEYIKNNNSNETQVDRCIKHIEGKNRFLVTAGHSANHFREGKIKVAEWFTGTIAILLADITGSHSLYVSSNILFDPNFDVNDPFKIYLKKITNKYKIDGILDIHGCLRERPFDVSLGVSRQKQTDQFISSIKTAFAMSGLIIDKDNTFQALKRETITSYASEDLHISCVQVEINGKYRDPINRPENFAKILSVLSKPLGMEE